MSPRERACCRLIELMRCELVGDMLDLAADRDARDLALKLIHRLREVAQTEADTRCLQVGAGEVR